MGVREIGSECRRDSWGRKGVAMGEGEQGRIQHVFYKSYSIVEAVFDSFKFLFYVRY